MTDPTAATAYEWAPIEGPVVPPIDVTPLVATFRRMAAADPVREQLLRAIDPTLDRAVTSPDRHTRAMAQARAAGITGIRDALTANA